MTARLRSASQAAAIGALVWAAATGATTGAPPPRGWHQQYYSALRSLQTGDASGTVKVLEQLTAEGVREAEVWRALGAAHQRLHEYDRSIAAYQHALELEPDAPRVFYALGASYAARHGTERAFQWLQRARETRRYDMTQLTVDGDVASLRDDPRFPGLLPRPEEFDQPFAEPVKIIREWRGEASNDQFGWIARNIGDVDGDGIADVATSAPTHGTAGSGAGRIYVLSTGTGKLLWQADGGAGDELGTGIEGAGDTNGDGIPDVVASGPGRTGVAFIYSGRDGRILQRFTSPAAEESFGRHVSGAGDLDHDGHADIIVGSPGKEGESRTAGHAYVYSGSDGRLLMSLTGERPGDEFGSTVAGYQEGRQHYLIVGAARAGARRHGRAYVYDGRAPTPKLVIESDETGNALGAMFVTATGDMDGDGSSEIYASDWSNTARGWSTGRVYIHSGRTGKRLLTLTGQTAGEGFGTSASRTGDVDGDGRADLIVGAWQYAGAAVSGGRAYLYSGKTEALLKTYTCRIPGDTFGFDAVGMGDVDHDGSVDFLITSAWSGVHGFHSGRVFVISSGVRPLEATAR